MENINPLMVTLRARIPGETFRLPSQGVFYVNGELDESVLNGEVHVYPMTAIDEVIMKTPDKLFSGEAVRDVFSRCVPQVRQSNKLLSKDIDYLLVCMRLLSYGDSMELVYKHTCSEAKEQTYKVALRPLIVSARAIDPTTIGTTFTITMASGQIVKMKPPVFENVISLYHATSMANYDGDDDLILLQERMIRVIVGMIISVDDVTDSDMIAEWVSNIPTGWTSELGARATAVSHWGIDTAVKQVCADCGEEIEMEVPINPISFFI